MEFTMQTEELTKGLYRALGIVEKKTSMPILSNVLFEATADGTVFITATDLEIGMIGEHDAEVKDVGAVTVSAKCVYDIVKSLPDGSVTIKRLPNQWVEIRPDVEGRDIEYKILGMSADDFHEVPGLSDADMFDVNSGMLKTMIDKVSYAIATDEVRGNLNGVLLEFVGKGVFRMVATDGHRLSMVDCGMCDKDVKFGDSVVIPRKGLMEMKRLLDSESGGCQIGVVGNSFIFKMDGVSVVMQLLDGKFPDYSQVVPKEHEIKVSVDRKALMDSLKRVSILSAGSVVSVVIENGRLTLIGKDVDLGEAREDIGIDDDKCAVSVGYNAKYVIDVLSAMDSECVELSMVDNLSPGVIKAVGDEDYTCVVMPMRL